MIWADKIALFLWFPLTMFAGIMCLGAPATSPDFIQTWLDLTGVFLLPIWLLLRAADFASGGPARRKDRAENPVIRIYH